MDCVTDGSTKFPYSRKRRQDGKGKQSDKAAIRDLVLTYCPNKENKLLNAVPDLQIRALKAGNKFMLKSPETDLS